ncbi:MAG TPA: aminoacyl-tRNA hydrolase [Dictyobacter sp.]|jgi:PTH1 family peptidyl-tRNA hydrolase|nr:aminoacyl-tRNA hydrolase [Dictyobacter sp.]
MKLIIGLGNPGAQYERTRHNVGFRVVDTIAKNNNLHWERKGRAMLATGTLAGEKVVLVKPLTYMNNSGEAVGELMRWHKLDHEHVLVIYDDLDLPVGQIRLRAKGSAGGHNGIKSLIKHLHTDQFPRLRVGIGHPAHQQTEVLNYVLGTPPTDERIQLETGEDKAAETVSVFLQQGIDATMNSVNVDPDAKKKAEARRQEQLDRREQRRKEAELARKNEQSEIDNTKTA